ncbi:uncharacterized protein B0T15DRAFT_116418 [Chaetomium strumarium]|uniref:Uncharacterized protein n=1 Tax=Chaetomium strumarium TaxID=1170767 RepID=A0AAJ0GYW4_9PEZI|nr:hypothetical protein B0T15DRAFT_116418 [Chaetomium strumarium]
MLAANAATTLPSRFTLCLAIPDHMLKQAPKSSIGFVLGQSVFKLLITGTRLVGHHDTLVYVASAVPRHGRDSGRSKDENHGLAARTFWRGPPHVSAPHHPPGLV